MNSYYDSTYEITKDISAIIGVNPIPFDSVYSIALEIYNELGGEETQFDSVYSILLNILPLLQNKYKGLRFTSTGNSTVALAQIGSAPTVDLEYSLDDGETWTQWDFSAISLSDGQSVSFKGLNTTFATSSNDYNKFVMTGSIAAHGNIMSIIDDGALTTTTIPANYCFYSLFLGCTSLTTAPELPATTLANNCYGDMFSGCTSLTTAPELPATTLENSCYQNMFSRCSSLTTAPELPATILANSCYRGMLSNCTSLTTAQSILPATILANSCYGDMFYGCRSLTTAPELPAPTLANGCYWNMFYRCSSLNSIKCLAINISAKNCTANWVNGVSSTGTFIKAANMTDWTTGVNGIPEGWTVEDGPESAVIEPIIAWGLRPSIVDSDYTEPEVTEPIIVGANGIPTNLTVEDDTEPAVTEPIIVDDEGIE